MTTSKAVAVAVPGKSGRDDRADVVGPGLSDDVGFARRGRLSGALPLDAATRAGSEST